MTLQISEIGVRLAVGDPVASGTAPSQDGDAPSGAGAEVSPAQIEEIVQACVADVLRTLRMLEER